MAKIEVDTFMLKGCQLLGELDRLFMNELDGWLPTLGSQMEIVVQDNIGAILVINPINWRNTKSHILCKFYKAGDTWRLTEVTIKAPHIHNTAIGGIDVTLPICDLPGITIGLPQESVSPSADVISSIILKKDPTSPSKFN